jgi:hypothetical protein
VGCYRTNILAVGPDQRYWPPICDENCYDTLEWAYSKQLLGYYDNYRYVYSKFNFEQEISDKHNPQTIIPPKESLDLFSIAYDRKNNSLLLQIKGKYHWKTRLLNRCIWLWNKLDFF